MSIAWGFQSADRRQLSLVLQRGREEFEIRQADLVEVFRALMDYWRLTFPSDGHRMTPETLNHELKSKTDLAEMDTNPPKLIFHGNELENWEVTCFLERVVFYLRNKERVEGKHQIVKQMLSSIGHNVSGGHVDQPLMSKANDNAVDYRHVVTGQGEIQVEKLNGAISKLATSSKDNDHMDSTFGESDDNDDDYGCDC